MGIVGVSSARAQTGSDGASLEESAAKKPPPAPPLQIAGDWSGTITDPEQGPGSVSLSFSEKSSKTKSPLTGTWAITFTSGPAGEFTDIGTIAGSVTASTVAITMKSIKGDRLAGALVFQSTQATEQAISGNFHFPMDTSHQGPFSIQRSDAPATVFVNIGDRFFSPNKLTIRVGQTVHWINRGAGHYAVDSNDPSGKCKPASPEVFDSGTLNPGANPNNLEGDTFDHTFEHPGTFAYHSSLNKCSMKGVVIVE